jgi:hypothetical protein
VQLLGLDRRGFTMDAIKRGFKVASAVIDVGDDPAGRDMLLAASLGLAGTLYGAPAAPAAPRPRTVAAAPQPELPPAAAPAGAPTAPSAPAPPASTAVRFEALSAEKQIEQLKELAQRKRYALDSLKDARKKSITLADFNAAQRLKFYEHLNRLRDAQR